MINNKMRAFICTEYGGPEVLKLVEVDKPIPKNNEVLIKIKATSVNSGDVRVRGLQVEGLMRIIMRLVLGFNRPKKPILGLVLSGIVEEVGQDVKKFKVGDEVFASTGFRFGTNAEYIALPEDFTLTLKPTNATHEEAVSILFGGMTAIHFLDKAGIQNSNAKNILIYGSTGAVGSAAIQIAKYYNWHITSVCSQSGSELSLRLGSERVIDYSNAEEMSKLDQKFDIIFDAVGKIDKGFVKKHLSGTGKFVTVGGLDVAKENTHQMLLLKDLYEKGLFQPVIDRVYDFEDLVEAHKYVDMGHKKGNVVIGLD